MLWMLLLIPLSELFSRRPWALCSRCVMTARDGAAPLSHTSWTVNIHYTQVADNFPYTFLVTYECRWRTSSGDVRIQVAYKIGWRIWVPSTSCFMCVWGRRCSYCYLQDDASTVTYKTMLVLLFTRRCMYCYLQDDAGTVTCKTMIVLLLARWCSYCYLQADACTVTYKTMYVLLLARRCMYCYVQDYARPVTY